MLDEKPQIITGREKLLTAKEVAAWLDCSEKWVLAHAAAGRRPVLPRVKIGKMVRFRSSDVRAFIEHCQQYADGHAA